MKKIGIIGGLAWPSTIDYYRLICAGANAHFRSLGHPMPLPTPPMMIESVNMVETRKLRGNPDGDRLGALRHPLSRGLWPPPGGGLRLRPDRQQHAACPPSCHSPGP